MRDLKLWLDTVELKRVRDMEMREEKLIFLLK